MLTVFIVVMIILAYAWVVYPGLMLLVPRKKTLKPAMVTELPSLAIIFSAHNEEKVIGARLANLTSLDYPYEHLTIYVGVDGCTDRTEAIARDWSLCDSRIHVFSRTPCQGKTAMLKKIVGELGSPESGDRGQGSVWKKKLVVSREFVPPTSLLVFTDANTMFERDSLRHLVAPFADRHVGGVCGRLVFVRETVTDSSALSPDPGPGTASGGTNEPTYWNLETRMKEAESHLDSCLGANGAIYAIRCELFPGRIPDNVIIDDFVIGMKVREQGFRMVFEPTAVAREDLPESVRDEWRRRIRIGAGAYQALNLCRACLSPRFGIFSWAFWSHKVLRWFTPHLLCVLFGIIFWVLLQWIIAEEGWVLNLTAVALAFAILGGLLMYDAWSRFTKLADLVYYFLAMQVALLVGFLRFCRGNLSGKWERTAR
jgi:poly-beta-1,6-N-acetyl-D-glucosamine synthase